MAVKAASRKPRTTTRRKTSATRAPARKKAGRRAQNKEATQKRIVSAALFLFQTRGFEATTTREIARKANIAEGTLFNYFNTKEDIALHFFEQEVDHAITAVNADERLRRAPLEEQLFTLLHTQLQYLARHERFIGAAFHEALKPSSKLGVFSHRSMALRHKYVAFVQELVERSSRGKKIPAATWWVPDAFWIYYLGVLLFWLNDESPRKQNTLAFIDRTLKFGVGLIKRAL